MITFKEIREGRFVHRMHVYDTEDEVGSRYSEYDTRTGRKHREEKIHKIPLNQLVPHEDVEKTHPSTASKESSDKINDIMKTIKSGKGHTLPPVKVVRHQTGGGYTVVDGHHRLEAHRRLGLKHISANIVNPSRVKYDH